MQAQPLTAYAIIATKGRAAETARLLEGLAAQTFPPALTIVIGSEPKDVAGLEEAAARLRLPAKIALARAAGLPLQRNEGLAALAATRPAAPYFVAYFDDDYRPDPGWMAAAQAAFAAHRDLAGLTGQILADGARGPGLTEAEAADYLSSACAPQRHWASGDAPFDTPSVYGCNMAFRDNVSEACRFDENLPLYGWQEDRDYTTQALRFGRVLYWPAAKGVHLGVKGGRTSGVRFGYSQIANLIYLARKGSVAWRDALGFIAKNVAANHIKLLRPEPWVDRAGRVRGNWCAFRDLAQGRLSPSRVMEL